GRPSPGRTAGPARAARCGGTANRPRDGRTASASWPIHAMEPGPRLLPYVEALAGLLPQLPLGDFPPQELRRPERRAELALEVLGDGQADVQPDEVAELERAHRVAVAELHRLVDVLRARDPLLHHADRLEADEDAETARREPRRIAHHDRLL